MAGTLARVRRGLFGVVLAMLAAGGVAAAVVGDPPPQPTALRSTGPHAALVFDEETTTTTEPPPDSTASTTTTTAATKRNEPVSRPTTTLRLRPVPTPGLPTTIPMPSLVTTTTTAPPAPQPLEVRVRTDRAAYVAGQEVRVDVDVCNPGKESTRRWVYDRQEAMFYLVDADGRRVTSGANTGGEGRWVEWQPGQCRAAAPLEWDQSTNMVEVFKQGGARYTRVKAGTYRIEADFLGQYPVDEQRAPWGWGPSGFSAPFELKGVTATVTTSKPGYLPGEPVAITASICNPNASPHTETIVWDPDLELRVVRDGSTRATQGSPKGPVDPYPMHFDGRQCRTYTWLWDQVDDHERTQVERGRYEVESLWFGHSNPDPPSGQAAHAGMWIDRVPFGIG